MTEYKTIRYEDVEDGVVRISMSRVHVRNAQDYRMTYELDHAFMRASADDSVKVMILAGDGPHWNAGHDQVTRGELSEIETTGSWFGYTLPGIEGLMARNKETYFDICWRWRNIPKPIIAQAHGKTIGGGLMLLWVCDIIVASDDASFADPVVAIGCNGVEYFGHPWEFGVRKAKELLFTSDFLSAEEAKQIGMVNQVVPRADLEEYTLAMARKIAKKPSLGLKLAKEAVNGMLDVQGQFAAMRAAFSLCSLGHAQFMITGARSGGYGEGFFNKQPARELKSEASLKPAEEQPQQ